VGYRKQKRKEPKRSYKKRMEWDPILTIYSQAYSTSNWKGRSER